MEKLTIAASIVLFLVALFSRRPVTSVLALAASLMFGLLVVRRV